MNGVRERLDAFGVVNQDDEEDDEEDEAVGAANDDEDNGVNNDDDGQTENYKKRKTERGAFAQKRYIIPANRQHEPVACEHCPKISPNLAEYRLHIANFKHKTARKYGARIWSCQYQNCSFAHNRAGSHLEHLRKEHGHEAIFHCPDPLHRGCLNPNTDDQIAEFVTDATLLGHLTRIHGEKIVNSKGKPVASKLAKQYCNLQRQAYENYAVDRDLEDINQFLRANKKISKAEYKRLSEIEPSNRVPKTK